MTILNKTLVSAGLAALLALGSGCKKYLDVNENRDSPQDAPPAAILTGAQVTTGFVLGGADVALTASLLTNQVDGTSQQFKNYQLYQIVADNLTNCWGSIYQGMLNNLIELRKKADAQKWYFFSGTSKILTAYVLGATTDLWGDIPYSDGFQGLDYKFKSKYDKQEDIYKAIDGLLTAGIADLQQPQLGLMPGDNDVMYSGSTKLWIKFANSFRLRTLIHLTKKDPAGYAQKVIDAAGAAGGIITKPEEIAQIYFLADPTRANPIQQFNDQRPGYVTYGESAMFEAMNALEDPRVTPYLDGAYDSKNSPVYLMTDYEVNFILAEAHARLGHDADAQKYYEAGIQGSFASVKTDPGDYLTKPAVKYNPAATAEDKLKLIMTQKYYAMYLQAENFTDWRRTGYPVLTTKNAGKEIPRRFPYPQSELSYNKSNVPTGISLTSKMWWDQ